MTKSEGGAFIGGKGGDMSVGEGWTVKSERGGTSVEGWGTCQWREGLTTQEGVAKSPGGGNILTPQWGV